MKHKRIQAHIKSNAPANPAGYQAAVGVFTGPRAAQLNRQAQLPGTGNPNISEQAAIDGAMSAHTLPDY